MNPRLVTRLILLVVTALGMGGFPSQPEAADVRVNDYGVVIEGTIERGDLDRVLRAVRKGYAETSGVWLFSGGGDFDEAIKIGRALRELGLSSYVPVRTTAGRPSCGESFGILPVPTKASNCTCASACFFIHIGAVHRGGSFLAVHRPYVDPRAFGALDGRSAEAAFRRLQVDAKEYMNEMGVPLHLQEEILSTPPESAVVLDDKVVKTHFWGEIPHIHDWTRAKCKMLSAAESERLERLGAVEANARRTAAVGMSPQDEADFRALGKKKKEAEECAIKVERDRRFAGYQKFFGVKPDDTESHNFALWHGATRYLGRSFDELLRTERFQEKSISGSDALELEGSDSFPSVLLFASASKPRVASTASLARGPVSDEFLRRLVESITAEWGSPLGKKDGAERLWVKDREFTATLIVGGGRSVLLQISNIR